MRTRHWLLLFLLWSALAWASFARPIIFEWDGSTDATVTGYRVYIGTTADFTRTNAVASLTTATTEVTWTNATAGMDIWVYVVATNWCCESDPSNVIEIHVPTGAGTLRFRLSLQSAKDVQGPWTPEGPCVDIEVPADGMKFYRGWVAMERL